MKLSRKSCMKTKSMHSLCLSGLTTTREARTRLEKQQETKSFVEQFMKERQNWLEEERTRQEEENAKIAAFAKMQKDREDDATAKKIMLAAGKDAIYDRVHCLLPLPTNNRESLHRKLQTKNR